MDRTRPGDEKTRNIFNTMLDINTEPITLDELRDVFKKTKNSKAPGPEGIPVEF